MNPQTLPATCELCGNWLPGHSSACPRNGVHPSQWKDIHFEEQLDVVNTNDEYEMLEALYLVELGVGSD